TDEEPDRDADQRDRRADDQRNARTVDHAAVDVAAETVRPHAVGKGAGGAVVVADGLLVAGRAIAQRRIDLGWAFRAQHRCGNRNDQHARNDQRAEAYSAVTCEPLEQTALARPGGGRLCREENWLDTQ